MPHNTLTVSVVICTKDRPEELLKCLESIALQTVPPSEIVIVDASSSWDGHTLDYQWAAQQVPLRHVPAPEGLTLQRNIGIRLSQGDVVLFLDDDVVLDKNYIAATVAVFELDPVGGVWGVEGEVWNDPYEHDLSAWKNKLWGWLFLQGGQRRGGGHMLPSGVPMYCSHSDSVVPVEVSIGITAYRREVFQEFLFDEHLQKYAFMEDTDFSYRVSRKHRIYHTPFAQLAHYPSPKARLNNEEMAEMRAYNHSYVFKKNFSQTIFHQFCFWWFNLGLVVRSLFRNSLEETLGLFRGWRCAWKNSIDETNSENRKSELGGEVKGWGKMRKKLRILILSEAVNRIGGIEKYTRDLEAAMGVQLGSENILLVSVPAFRNGLPRKIFTLLSLFYYSLRFSPSYIFCGHIYLISYVIAVSWVLRIPYVTCTHGIEVWRDLPVWQTKAIRHAAKVITVSGYTKERLIEKGVSAEKISLIHNRVDINRFKNTCNTEKVRLAYGLEGKKILLIVGRMVSWERYKGHDELIRVLPDIIEKVPETVLLVVGSGDDVERLQDLCESLGLKDHVIFAGRVSNDELPSYYNACDVFIMPSRVIRKDDGRWGGEGFGIVFLEASACSKPVVGANSGGTLDAVVDQETGLLIDPENRQSLIEASVRLLNDQEYANRLGRNGREWAKKFDINQLPSLVRKLFEDLERGRKCAV